jgi:hypothetical protein
VPIADASVLFELKEHSMEQTQTDVGQLSWPTHWAHVIQDALLRFGNARNEPWTEELVYMQNGLPLPIDHEDRVARGFARKTAKRLEQVCTLCGRRAKPRYFDLRWTVRCSCCHGRAALIHHIDALLDDASGKCISPFDGKSALWQEREMNIMLSGCIPVECWRFLALPEGLPLRYLAREDVLALTPWFKQLQRVMRVDLGEGRA